MLLDRVRLSDSNGDLFQLYGLVLLKVDAECFTRPGIFSLLIFPVDILDLEIPVIGLAWDCLSLEL